MHGEEVLELLRIERSSGAHEVVDRPLGLKAERQSHVSELEIEVDDRHAVSRVGERDREIDGRQRLAAAALQAQHADHATELLSGYDRVAAAARHSLLERE